MQTAHTLRRAAARFVDLGVSLALLELAGRLADLLPVRALLQLDGTLLVNAEIGVGLASLLLYTAVSEALGGQSVGKLLSNVQVVQQDGEPVDVRGAVLRNLALPVDLFLFGLVAYSAMSRSPERCRVGDGLARTRVVQGGTGIRGAVGALAGAGAALGLLLGSYVVF